MPGKYFLFLCMLWPFLNSCYRAIIYFYLSECEFDSHVVTTALFGIIMMETWGLFVYLIYFIRVSFQRQFSLILVYLRDFEGHIDRCRGAILCAFADYNLFKTFCNGYFLLTFPVIVIGLTSHITWQYLLYQVCATDLSIMKTQNFLRWLVLSEISMALFLYIFASGGMSVNYLGLQLHSNVLKLKSAAHALFWDEIVQVVDTTNRGSQLLYLSVFFSTVGIFMSLQFNDQDVTYMNARYNTTNMTICWSWVDKVSPLLKSEAKSINSILGLMIEVFVLINFFIQQPYVALYCISYNTIEYITHNCMHQLLLI